MGRQVTKLFAPEAAPPETVAEQFLRMLPGMVYWVAALLAVPMVGSGIVRREAEFFPFLAPGDAFGYLDSPNGAIGFFGYALFYSCFFSIPYVLLGALRHTAVRTRRLWLAVVSFVTAMILGPAITSLLRSWPPWLTWVAWGGLCVFALSAPLMPRQRKP